MRADSWRTWLVLLLVIISLPAIFILASRQFPAKPELKPLDNNPDKFYLLYTAGDGRKFSLSFTYDPHEADLWMFRTAEGHLEGSSTIQTPGTSPAPKATPP